jgi:hypothetical protein
VVRDLDMAALYQGPGRCICRSNGYNCKCPTVPVIIRRADVDEITGNSRQVWDVMELGGRSHGASLISDMLGSIKCRMLMR